MRNVKGLGGTSPVFPFRSREGTRVANGRNPHPGFPLKSSFVDFRGRSAAHSGSHLTPDPFRVGLFTGWKGGDIEAVEAK
jgi:hypothetical protein